MKNVSPPSTPLGSNYPIDVDPVYHFFAPGLRAITDSKLNELIQPIKDSLVANHVAGQRARSSTRWESLLEISEAIILNLTFLISVRKVGEHWLRVPTGSMFLDSKSLGALFTSRRIREVLNLLEQSQYIIRDRKSIEGSRPATVIKPTIKLVESVAISPEEFHIGLQVMEVESPCVVVKQPKDDPRKRIASADLPKPLQSELVAIAQQMREVNDHLSSYDLKGMVDGRLVSLKELTAKTALTPQRLKASKKCHLVRIFNNGSLAHGGRLYRGFWQDIGKNERKRLRLNGEELTSLDYQAIGIRLALASVGIDCPEDTDPYQRLLKLVPNIDRGAVKQTVNTCLSCYSITSQWPNGLSSCFPAGYTWKRVKQMVFQAYPELQDIWFNALGLRLQRLESDIMVTILLNAKQQGLSVLPVHDAVLCPRSEQQKVMSLMVDCYKQHTKGLTPKVSVEW